jgi:hypothetical protein
MTDIGPSGYMTDGQIIAWLEQKSDDQYGDLRNQMGASNDRATLIKNLTDARAAVDGGKPDDAFNTLDDTRQQCNDPETEYFCFDEQIKLLGWTSKGHDKADALDQAIDSSDLSDAQKQALKTEVDAARTVMDASDTNVATDANAKMHDAQQKRVGEDLQSKTDDLGRIDNLALINIQQGVNDAKQTSELASNILSSRDQTSNAILGNVRG